LVEETERIVTRKGPGGLEHKYEDFYATGTYGGIATGYSLDAVFAMSFAGSAGLVTFQKSSVSFIHQKELSIA
jgi:hypothetical protein